MIVLNYSVTILIILFVILLASILWVRFYLYIITIQGTSMSPTLREMDRILVLRRWPTKLLQRGQIVIGLFQDILPEGKDFFDEKLNFYIKRIVGLPGDTIIVEISQIRDIDYSSTQYSYDTADGNRVWSIPKGFCFVRGDNSLMSTDSIFWGPVQLDSIVGVMLIKLPRSDNNSESPKIDFSNENNYT